MYEAIMQAVPAIISASTLGAVGFLANRVTKFVKGFEQEHATLMESQRNQLKAAIVDRYERAVERGFVTQIELESANRMYDSYKSLGGNHYIKALISQLNEMEARGEVPYEH